MASVPRSNSSAAARSYADVDGEGALDGAGKAGGCGTPPGVCADGERSSVRSKSPWSVSSSVSTSSTPTSPLSA